MILREGKLEFDFSSAKHVEKLDTQGRTQPQGMALVDFVVETDNSLLMIEVKDPSAAKAGAHAEREAFIAGLAGDDWIAHKMVPKGRDTYTYLHLMARDSKPLRYIVLVADDDLSLDSALLVAATDRLRARLHKECDEPWRRPYVEDCVVMGIEAWRVALHYTVTRL